MRTGLSGIYSDALRAGMDERIKFWGQRHTSISEAFSELSVSFKPFPFF
jgi:hypothetical protein